MGAMMDRLEAIERLAKLKDSGILTDEEFQQQKLKLLSASLTSVPVARPIPVAAPSHYQAPVTHHVNVYHDTGMNTRTQLEYDASKKSVLVGYLLWLFAAPLSIHRFYVHKWVSGFLQMLTGISALILFIPASMSIFIPGAGAFGLFMILPFIWWAWWFFDAILIVRWVRKYNQRLVQQLCD